MKVLKGVAWAFLALALVAVLAGVGLWLFFDPDQLKPHIERQVEARTGRQLTLEGDVSLSLFPWVGVVFGPATLSNAPGFGNKPFATVQKVDVKVQLLPLLRRELLSDIVVLDGLELALSRKRNGQTNWTDLVERGKSTAPGTSQPGASTPTAGVPEAKGQTQVAALALGGLRVADAALIWDDRQTGQKIKVQALSLETGAIVPGRPVDLQTRFGLVTTEPKAKSDVEFMGELNVDPQAQRYELKEGSLNVKIRSDTLPGGVFETRLAIGASVDMARQIAEIRQLKGTVYGIAFDGSFKGTNISDNPSFKGALKTGEFAPDDLIAKLGGEAPATADPQVLKRASLEMDLIADTRSVALSRLVAVLDDTELTGTAGVTNFSEPAVTFDLQVNRIDLDRYRPGSEPGNEAQAGSDPAPSEVKGEKPARKNEAETESSAGPDLTALRSLDLRGSLQVQDLRVNNLDLAKTLVKIRAVDGRVRVDPFRTALYGGQARGKIELNVNGAQPSWSANVSVKRIQAEPLLQALTGEAALTGRGGFNANLQAVGLTGPQIERTLDGKLGFVFRDGAIKGINVAHIMRQAKAVLRGEPAPAESGPNQTDFAELRASAQSAKGLLVNRDLMLKAPLLRVSGEGKAYLPEDKVDYEAVVAVVNTLEGEGGKEFADLEGLEIPVLIRGRLSDPTIRPDLEALARAEARRQLEKHGDEIQEKAEKRLKEELGEKAGGELGDVLKRYLKLPN